jgi:UDP-2,3-diacylglucosamine pyrophosphatase LpxH
MNNSDLIPIQSIEDRVRAEVERALGELGIASSLAEPDQPFQDGATLFVSDWHIPLHHRKATDALIAFCEANRDSGYLQRLVLGGDVFDGTNNSRYLKQSREDGHDGDLGDEIETGRSIVNALVECFPDAIFMEGNHEARIWRVLAEKKGIPAAPIVFEQLFKFYDYHERLQVTKNRSHFVGKGEGLIEFIHGERYNKHTAAALMSDNQWKNSVQGHTHRPQAFWSKGKFAIVNGHLHDQSKQTYMANPDWTMGFTVFEHWDRGRKVNPYFVRVCEDGSFGFLGKVWRG